MESRNQPEQRGLRLSPEDKDELSSLAAELTESWLDHPMLDGMDPKDKAEVQTFITTSFDALADNNLVVNDKTVSEIAIATAPGLERRRQREAYTDRATGLSNSDAFLAARPRIDEDPENGLIFIDLIGLGDINNRISYDIGTQTLIEAANCIRTEAKKLSIDERDIFRIGGDEFGVKVPNQHARYLLHNIIDCFGDSGRKDLGKAVTGLRGAYGETFEEVDEYMKELKVAGKRNWISRNLGKIAGVKPSIVTHLEYQ